MLLARLHPEREAAGYVYEQIRAGLIRFFERRGCASADALADETLDRVVKGLEGGKEIEHPRRYCFGVARLVARQWSRRLEREQRALEGFAAQVRHEASEDEGEAERKLARLNEALSELAPGERELILTYYRCAPHNGVAARKELAARLNIPPNALRIRAHRIRAKLAEALRQ
jgi:RNA polymerase sigma factor (sigma-70 family)